MPCAVDVHVIVRPVRVFPEASLTVALSVVVPPGSTLAVSGETLTVATAMVGEA
jgi:hypothetical protein